MVCSEQVSTLGVLLLCLPLILVFGVIFNSDKIVSWWEKKYPPEDD